MFSCEFYEFVKTPFLTEQLRWLLLSIHCHYWQRKTFPKENLGKLIHNASACNFIKKDTLVQVVSCEVWEISKNTFSYRTSTASKYSMSLLAMLNLFKVKPWSTHSWNLNFHNALLSAVICFYLKCTIKRLTENENEKSLRLISNEHLTILDKIFTHSMKKNSPAANWLSADGGLVIKLYSNYSLDIMNEVCHLWQIAHNRPNFYKLPKSFFKDGLKNRCCRTFLC